MDSYGNSLVTSLWNFESLAIALFFINLALPSSDPQCLVVRKTLELFKSLDINHFVRRESSISLGYLWGMALEVAWGTNASETVSWTFMRNWPVHAPFTESNWRKAGKAANLCTIVIVIVEKGTASSKDTGRMPGLVQNIVHLLVKGIWNSFLGLGIRKKRSPRERRLVNPTHQGSANYGLWVKHGLRPVFVCPLG